MSDNTKRYQADSKIQAVAITLSVIKQNRKKQSMSDNTKRYQADSNIQAVVITQSVMTQGRKATHE